MGKKGIEGSGNISIKKYNQILDKVELKDTVKTVTEAAAALDAALSGLTLKSNSSTSVLPVEKSVNKKSKILSAMNVHDTRTDISIKLGRSRSIPVNKKPSRSCSSNDISLLKKESRDCSKSNLKSATKKNEREQ